MKKKIMILFLSLCLVAFFCLITKNLNFTNYGIDIDVNNNKLTLAEDNPFKDANLYKCVIDAYNNQTKADDSNKKTTDQTLSEEEFKKITSLTCGSSYNSITDTTGLNSLTNLKFLSFTDNVLVLQNAKNLTLEFPDLIFFELNNSNVEVLDISKLPKVTTIRIKNNSNLREIKFFDEQGNVTSKDAIKNSSARLDYPQIENNDSLTSLDFSKMTNVIWIDAHNNKNLTNVNVNGCNELQYLILNDNNINTIDVSNNVNLTTLELNNNNLSSINVDSNTALNYLEISNNNLTSIDVSKNNKLIRLYLDNNKLSNIDLSANKNVAALKLDGNKFTSSKTYTIYKDEAFNINEKLNKEITDNRIVSEIVTIPTSKSYHEKVGDALADSKVSFVNALGNNNIKVSGDNITASKTGTFTIDAVYQHNLYLNDMLTTKATKFKVTYNIEVIELTAKDNRYIINNEKGYIYVSSDTDTDTIKNNLEVNSQNAKIEINDNNVIVKDNDNTTLKEFKIINISSTNSEYEKTIKDGYIFIGNNEYNDGDIISENADIIYDKANNVIKVIYEKEIPITTITVISISVKDYNLDTTANENYIYTKNSIFNKDNVTVKGVKSSDIVYEDNIYKINYNNKNVITYKILSYKINNNYKSSTNYIYTKDKTFDINKDIELTGFAISDISVDNNKLKISYESKILDTIDIVTYSSDTYTLGEDYIYTGKETFSKDKIKLSNTSDSDIKFTNQGYTNYVELYYNGTYLDKITIITYTSSKYDFSNKYYDLGTSTYVNGSVTVRPPLEARVVYDDNTLKITYKGKTIDTLDILKYNSTTYNLNKDDTLDEYYIYLGTEAFHESNITKSDNVTLKVEDNALKIMYKEEIVKVYNLLKITSFGNLVNASHLISLEEKNYTYEDFIKEITTNNQDLKIKVYNKNTEVTSGDITKGMIVNVEYKNKILHTYTVVNKIDEEYLNFNDLKHDESATDGNKYLLDLEANLSVDSLKNEIDTTGDITVTDRKGNITNKVGTGCVLKVEFKNGTSVEYILIVRGDTTGDGKIDLNDVTKDFQYYRKKIQLENYFVKAGKVIDKNSSITLNDVTKLFQYYRGKIDSLEG